MKLQQLVKRGTVGPGQADSQILHRIARNARLIRRGRRLTLNDVAGAAGITVGALSRIESGQKMPSLQTLVRICDVMGVSVAEILQRPVVWAGPSISRLAHGRPPTGFLQLSRPGELRVRVFHGELPSGAGGTSEGPVDGGIVAISAKEGISIIRQGETEHVVRPGDALTIGSVGPVRWNNTGRNPASALWIYTPARMASGSPFRADAPTGY